MLNVSKNNDDIYKNITQSVHDTAKELKTNRKTIPLNAHILVKLGEKPVLTLKFDDFEIKCTGDTPAQQAQKSPTDADRIFKQISKFGGTPFHAENVSVDVDDNINIPISVLNDLRRKAVELAQDHIVSEYRRSSDCHFCKENLLSVTEAVGVPAISASVFTYAQAKAAYDAGFDRIYITYDVYCAHKDFFDENADIFALRLPSIMREGAENRYSDVKLETVCIGNISQINLFKDKKIHADYTMNVFNSYSQQMLVNMGADSVCLSPELNMSQLDEIEHTSTQEIIVYGSLPLMTVRNCLFKSANGKCGCNESDVYYLRDRKDTYFPFITHPDSCTNTVYNSVPIYMGDKMDQIDSLNVDMHRFEFTFESPYEITEIIEMYKKGASYKNKNFTRGVQ